MQKEELRQNSKELIDKLFNQINDLEAKKDSVTGSVKDEYNDTINSLKEKKDALADKYNHIQEDTEARWNTLSEAFSEASEILRKSIMKASAK